MNGHEYIVLTLEYTPSFQPVAMYFKSILVSQTSFIELQQLWPIHFILQKNFAKMYVG